MVTSLNRVARTLAIVAELFVSLLAIIARARCIKLDCVGCFVGEEEGAIAKTLSLLWS